MPALIILYLVRLEEAKFNYRYRTSALGMVAKEQPKIGN
jgi:hypothetical protein